MDKLAQNIQEAFLNNARKEKTFLTIYLMSGVKLSGSIKASINTRWCSKLITRSNSFSNTPSRPWWSPGLSTRPVFTLAVGQLQEVPFLRRRNSPTRNFSARLYVASLRQIVKCKTIRNEL